MATKHAQIVSQFRLVVVWNDEPTAAFEHLRDAEAKFNQVIREHQTGFGADADLICDVGGIELEIREYDTSGEEYVVIKSALLRPESDNDDRGPRDPVEPPPPEPVINA